MQQPIITAAQLFEFLQKKYQDLFESVEIELDEVCVLLQANQLIKFISSLRDDPHLQFSQLMDVTAVDYPEREVRFEIVYHFLSLENNLRIRVKLPLDESSAVPSLINYYKSANWFEREVWDMFGIPFENHPDLRRILSDYGFRGHPLRKDFPLTGYVEMRYDSSQAKVVYEPVKLVQDFRNFDFLSPWEAMTGAGLPGDEKAMAQKPKTGGA